MRLVLVRHAAVEESAHGRCYGTLDVGLSPTGRAQSVSLARMIGAEPVARVVSSPRVRAVDTAVAIAEPHGLNVDVDDALREIDFGELEGRTYDEIAAELPDLYAAWMTAPTTVRFPGGECYADLEARAIGAVSALRRAYDERTVVVVTHGGVVRAVVADVLGIPPERIFRIGVEPASLTVVEWLGDEPIVKCFNSAL
jgi:alpha-ribazole phosphatase/probable phosphoglycerate mutase